jgi:hypothetical protein
MKFLFLFLSWVTPAKADRVKVLSVCENMVVDVAISPYGTVLDIPVEPEKVILGTKGSFNVEYVKTDLAISPTNSQSKSNLFVYLLGRRFAFELKTSPAAPTLYFVRDCTEKIPTNKKANVRTK